MEEADGNVKIMMMDLENSFPLTGTLRTRGHGFKVKSKRARGGSE